MELDKHCFLVLAVHLQTILGWPYYPVTWQREVLRPIAQEYNPPNNPQLKEVVFELNAHRLMSKNVVRAAKRGYLPYSKITRLGVYYPAVAKLKGNHKKETSGKAKPGWSGAKMLGSQSHGKKTEERAQYDWTTGYDPPDFIPGAKDVWSIMRRAIPDIWLRNRKNLPKSSLEHTRRSPRKWTRNNSRPHSSWRKVEEKSSKVRPKSKDKQANRRWQSPHSHYEDGQPIGALQSHTWQKQLSNTWSPKSSLPKPWFEEKALSLGKNTRGYGHGAHYRGSKEERGPQHGQALSVHHVHNLNGASACTSQGLYLVDPSNHCGYRECVQEFTGKGLATVSRPCPPGLAVSARFSAAKTNPCTIYDDLCHRAI